MKRRLSVGRILDVDVAIDWSWLVAFVLATWTFVSVNRHLITWLSSTRIILASVLAAAGLFASLVAHELVRIKVEHSRGVPVRRLTLFVLGGVTDVECLPTSKRADLFAAIAAPLASMVIAAVILAGVAITSAPLPRAIDDLNRLGMSGVVLVEVAMGSLAVAAVNLLPAYPLDGGRILRAMLWRATNNVDRATRISAWSGQVIGFTLVAVGVVLVIIGERWISGLGAWLAFIGWFVASGAAQGYEAVRKERSATSS